MVCGGGGHERLLLEQARSIGREESFKILGPIDNVPEVMSTFDVYGYRFAKIPTPLQSSVCKRRCFWEFHRLFFPTEALKP